MSDIQELSARLTKLEHQQDKEVEDKVNKHMDKIIKQSQFMEIYLQAILMFPIVIGLAGSYNTTNPVADAFYLGVTAIGIIGVVFVVLVKRILVELIYIELAARGHGRDDE
jgi:uncharacterized membrane protein YcjF (UPF0283 family)